MKLAFANRISRKSRFLGQRLQHGVAYRDWLMTRQMKKPKHMGFGFRFPARR
jgi:hypothetical protein